MLDVDEPPASRPDLVHEVHDFRRLAHALEVLGFLLEEALRLGACHLRMARNEPEVVFVVDRREVEVDLLPAADAVEARERRHDDSRDVRHVMERLPHLAAGARAVAHHPPLGLLGRDDGQIRR
ncbi:MAG: hypothetical protein ABR570_09400 [Burkholderiales bacterium]